MKTISLEVLWQETSYTKHWKNTSKCEQVSSQCLDVTRNNIMGFHLFILFSLYTRQGDKDNILPEISFWNWQL